MTPNLFGSSLSFSLFSAPRRFFLSSPSRTFHLLLRSPTMPQKKGGKRESQKWMAKADHDHSVADVQKRIGQLDIAEGSGAGGSAQVWKPKAYGTVAGVENAGTSEGRAVALSQMFKGNQLKSFVVDSSTHARAQIRAAFYPKFENEKSDQEVRQKMIEVVSDGQGTLEVSLKHSGSLFMYAGPSGGAYAKNSFGNIYTAVGVFVLGRIFRDAWGTSAEKKQMEFNDFLEKNHMCVSMELVTAVLGDHGQRPKEDYAVVTAVTELGNRMPKFYSTPEVISFCRKWRLPTNHIWLFSTRKSVASFFAAYDALCEEGTATTVCRALDEVADVSVTGSTDHIKVQGEILEGLVARVVSRESSKHIEEILKNYPPPPVEEAGIDLGPTLREICAANRSDEKQQIRALLQGVGSFFPNHSDWFAVESGHSHSRDADRSFVEKFLQANPADLSTTKLQEVVRLLKGYRSPVDFKCYNNFHKDDPASSVSLFYRMVIHVHSDSVFRRYQKEMRNKPGMWPLYRGFFIDVDLFKGNKEKLTDMPKENNLGGKFNGIDGNEEVDEFADDNSNLMIKLKFLTYKLRTFLIRNQLTKLFNEGPSAYKAGCLKQMKNWGTSPGKQRELTKMLDEWAVYILRKCGKKKLSSSVYLSEAEPFLEQYASRSPQNKALIGSVGSLVNAEDFLATIEAHRDEEGDLEPEKEMEPPDLGSPIRETVQKVEGLIVFFPGIPGCAKSALCKELVNAPEAFGDNREVYSLMGDLIKGRYWQKVADERRKKPRSILLADKNAPNEEVWRQIEDMCRSTRASAVPVVPDSEGSGSNPFSLDALAVFMYRVLQRVNHPGNLDKASPNAGYVLLMFYHLYDGKSRRDFEDELVERFSSLVRMPLLKSNRTPLPDPVKLVLEEGLNLYKLHTRRHGRLESTKGTYAKEWAKWEKQLREIVSSHAEYLNSIQVPFEDAAKHVLEQLQAIARGEYTPPSIEKRNFGSIVFAAVSLPVADISSFLEQLGLKNAMVKAFLENKDLKLNRAHVTLAHKRSHGVTAVANYAHLCHQSVPVDFTALLFTDKMAAFEAKLGSVNDENVVSKNQWPHLTIWTGDGVTAKDANTLPRLLAEGKATRVEISPPVTISGPLEFF